MAKISFSGTLITITAAFLAFLVPRFSMFSLTTFLKSSFNLKSRESLAFWFLKEFNSKGKTPCFLKLAKFT